MGSLAPVQCPACGYRGDEEICLQCGFPIGRYRDFLSGVPVLADEAWKRELEEQVRRHRIVYQQRFAAPIPPGTLVAAPDGSGNFRSLEEAVRQAQPGAVIYLKAGIPRVRVFRRQLPGTGFQVPGTWHPGPGTGSTPRAGHRAPKTEPGHWKTRTPGWHPSSETSFRDRQAYDAD